MANKKFNLLDVASLSESRVSKFSGLKKYVATADIDLNQITGGEEVTHDNRPSRADLIMGQHDVLFAKMRGTIKVLAGSPEVEDKIFSTGFYILTPKENVNKEYLYFCLLGNDFNRQKDLYSSGATMAAIGNDGLKRIKISLPINAKGNPDIKEQERIVSILEEAEVLKRKRTETDQKMATVIPALFNHMFGDIKANNRKWPIARFNEIGQSRLGKMLDAKKQTGKNKKPYIKNTNVRWGYFELDNLPEMDFTENEQEEFRLKSGDLLICEGGEIGRTAIWRNEISECYFQKALHRVRLNTTKAVPEYIAILLRMIAGDNGFRELIGTATIPHLTGVQLASIKIPVPPVELQNQFAERVKEIEALGSKQKESAEKIEKLFSSLLAQTFN